MKTQPQPADHISVGDYIDNLNEGLRAFNARVIGEITEIQMYEGRSYLFFKIKDKDKDNPAVLNCFMWKRDYNLCGVKIEEGLEVIVSGFPEIYKAYGRFSFRTQTIEPVGEGALKKAYEELKSRLTKEGLFNEERKRPLPRLPQNIGLITSKDGEVIHDFQINLGRFGFKVSFADSRVEGQQAVSDLLSAIKTMKSKDIEILVLIRGGGSLESLLSFNNEILVREIVNFPVPVLVGIGHEEDISLIDLAADKSVSTPTATAHALNKSWQEAVNQIQLNSHKILSTFNQEISNRKTLVQRSFHTILDEFQAIFDNFHRAEQLFFQSIVSIRSRISELRRRFNQYPGNFAKGMQGLIHRTQTYFSIILDSPISQFAHSLSSVKQSMSYIEKTLERENPEKQLKMGYSITQLRGKVVRKVEQVAIGDVVEVRVQDGAFESNVSEIRKMR